jgi:uncharacterized delta-60 repeat protein
MKTKRGQQGGAVSAAKEHTMREKWTVRLVVAAGGLVLATAALAAPGDLDASFGGDGIVTTAIGHGDDFAEGVALRPDGSLVAAGSDSEDFVVARYLPDGALDPSFGGDGIVTTAVSPSFDEARAVAAFPGGEVVAGGRAFTGAGYDIALVRYADDGSLDASFGGDGIVTTAVSGGTDEILALAPLAGGKLVAAGRTFDGVGFDFVVARYLPDGALDPSFGGDGIVTTSFGGDDRAWGVAVQHDGKIVVAGNTCTPAGCEFALARYDQNGSRDPSFGGDGTVVTAPGGSGTGGAFAVATAPHARIVVAGVRCRGVDGSDCDFAVVRYLPDGSLDPSFDGDGVALTSFGPGIDQAYGVAVEPNGTVVAAGRSFNGSDYDVAVARYKKDGGLDPGFATAGRVTTAIGPGDDLAAGVALGATGEVIVAGHAFNGTDLDFALARYAG